MALTNFASLTSTQKIVWSRELWKEAIAKTMAAKFFGTKGSNVIEIIKELTRTEKGEQAIIHLINELTSDGTRGDDPQEGHEEAMRSSNDIITMDRIAHQVRNTGEYSDQKSIINFRETARTGLANWLADRIDQLVFLTLSGIAYTYNNDGSTRTDATFGNLAFAADVSAPSTNRHLNWTGSALVAGDTATVAATYVPTYSMCVKLRAYAKVHRIKPLKNGGKDFYALFMHPQALAKLKLDTDYKNAVVSALPRDEMKNPFFTGASVTVDGLVIHDSEFVYNTFGAASGSKWGSGGTVDGTRTLLCGAQALGMVDLGPPKWNEKTFEYGNQQGISTSKMIGLLKPKYYSTKDGAVEDFGVIAVDHAIEQ